MKAKQTTSRQKRLIKYETMLWTVIATVSVLAIVDRFTTNYWPRQSFKIGAGSAGNDQIKGFKEGPWSVVAYDIIARVSGRFSIVAFNFMLITRLHILEQFLASSWVGKNIIDSSNIIKSNLEAHKMTGIALCVLTLIHVWSILLPCITHRWKAQVVPGSFEYPLSERTPPGFKDANVETQTMSLQVDDVFRMVEMTLLLGILVPLSIRWMDRCWHLGIQVHRFVSVLYFVDIVRRHSHPHSWVLNTPVFAIWILDKILSMSWRKIQRPSVNREKISSNYIVLYWKNNAVLDNYATEDSVGSKYFMKLQPSSWMESRHPFTTFRKREARQENHFTSGAVIRVFHDDRKPRIGGKSESRSHTERMAKEEKLNTTLSVWGPFQGNVSSVIPKTMLHRDATCLCIHYGQQRKNLVMVGSGSAVNFMIDLMLHLKQYNDDDGTLRDDLEEIILLFTTRDPELLTWVYVEMGAILCSIDESSNSKNINDIRRPNISIVLACTAVKDKDLLDDKALLDDTNASSLDSDVKFNTEEDSTTEVNDQDVEQKSFSPPYSMSDIENRNKNQFQTGSIEIINRRIDYEHRIPPRSDVFCQGSSGLKSAVMSSCRKKKNVKVYFD